MKGLLVTDHFVRRNAEMSQLEKFFAPTLMLTESDEKYLWYTGSAV
jgi:hypothetical protein